LIEKTSPDHPSFFLLQKAIARMNLAIVNINLARKRISNREVVQEFVSHLESWFISFIFNLLREGPGIDVLGGNLILNGNLKIVDSIHSVQDEYGFYLMERLLVILETVRTTKKGSKNGFFYRVVNYINLTAANVNDITNDGFLSS
jgi:hypothetical protein